MNTPIEVDLFIPCYVEHLFPNAGISVVKILEHLGCVVHFNPNQTCCGQPAYNAGQFEPARAVADKFIADFPNNRYIVGPSASCVGMLRDNYKELYKDHPEKKSEVDRIAKYSYEFIEFVTKVLGVDSITGAEFNHKITYHDSCSALREIKLKQEPRKLLSAVKGLELIEMKDTDVCCGFGGTFSVKFEQISSAMAEQKVENALETGAEYIVSTDVSCLMHQDAYIRRKGYNLKTIHIAEILASGL